MPTNLIATGWLPRDARTQLMVRQMQQLVEASYLDPVVRETATDIVRYATPRDYPGIARRIRNYLAEHIRFLRDPDGKEASYTPRLMLQSIKDYGIANVDCDDAAVLAATLGRSIGLQARFVLLGFLKPDNPLAHVYTELAGPGPLATWIEQDVTRSQREIPFNMITRRVIVPAKVAPQPPTLGQRLAAVLSR